MKPHSLENTPSQERPRLPRAAVAAVGSAALLALLAATAGCVVAVRPAPVGVVYSAEPGEVVVESDPPAPIYETVAVAPGPGYFWIGGYYHWYGNRWGWVGGHYERPPHPGAVWVRSRFDVRGGRRVYVHGYWH